MKVDWEKIYEGTIKPPSNGTDIWNDQTGSWELQNLLSAGKFNKKFEIPIRPIPWSDSYKENVSLTLEWLIRDHRHDTLRLQDGPLHSHIKEFWYHSEYYEGLYAHVCYPQELLTFRTQYDGLFEQFSNLPLSEMSSKALLLRKKLKNLLWVQWKCIGKDGIINKDDGKITYSYFCDRCGTDMPKAVKMYSILTQSKLKDVVT